MSSTHTIPEPVMESPSAPGRTFFISAAVAAACAAFAIAEYRGFRIFDENLSGSNVVATAIPSPMEFLALVGAISSGVVAGMVCALTSVGWLIYRLRQAPGAALDEDTASIEEDCAAHNISCQQ